MNKLDELSKRLDRIKVLMDATGMSMETLMAESATVHIDCEFCPIKESCDQYQYKYEAAIGCTAVWEMYLEGELNKDV